MRFCLIFLLVFCIAGCRGDDDDRDSSPLRSCGGLQGLSCKEGEFCDFEDLTCGAADALGACKPVPQICTLIFAPVCGCDGLTYPSDCNAAAAGMSLQSLTSCEETGGA